MNEQNTTGSEKDEYRIDSKSIFGCNVCDRRGVPLNDAGCCKPCMEAR